MSLLLKHEACLGGRWCNTRQAGVVADVTLGRLGVAVEVAPDKHTHHTVHGTATSCFASG